MKAGSFNEIIDEAFLARNLKKQVIVDNASFTKQPDLKHIVFGVDGDFLRHACIAMKSIIENAAQQLFSFHFITNEDVSTINKKLTAILTGTGHALTVHKISSTLFTNFPSTPLFTKAIYYRLLAPHILSEEKSLLYLDADIICLRPFREIWEEYDILSETAFVALENSEFTDELSDSIGLKGKNYFNSGVMLINIPAWIKNNITLAALSVLERHGHQFKYPDQDALNKVLEGKAGFLATKYNTIFKIEHDLNGYLALPPEETVFLHYAGADKPWQSWNEQAACKYYRRMHASSCWSSVSFDKPVKDWQAKKMYKLMFKKKSFVQGLRWYFTYLIFRYFK
ncbi:glycosyltransferase family 8 protein [Pantoea sp. FN060301]|uniref:glycosyltransferase family 8 protein n=1 Tax=Pantoea sp. FN060301 TaxID=3420380 RepID=UPI003D171D4D